MAVPGAYIAAEAAVQDGTAVAQVVACTVAAAVRAADVDTAAVAADAGIAAAVVQVVDADIVVVPAAQVPAAVLFPEIGLQGAEPEH